MTEYEGIEIPEELMEELAGGTMTRGHERRLEKLANYLKKQGRSKDECLNTLCDLIIFEEHDDIASVVERTYRY